MSDPDKGKIIPQRPEREGTPDMPAKPAKTDDTVRPGADTPAESEHLGATERDVAMPRPFSAPSDKGVDKSDEIDPEDELTPG